MGVLVRKSVTHVSTTILNAVRVLVFLIPLACLGAHFWGFRGVFWGRLITDVSVGCIGLVWAFRASRAALAAVQVEPSQAQEQNEASVTNGLDAAGQIFERDI